MLRRVLLLFFASGALGLGYQVLWSKLVLLFVGVSSWSYAIVLAAFMAGLALGSRFLGRFADRARSPLAMFGWLELGVGAYAVAYPILSDAAAKLYLRLAAASSQHAGDPSLLLLKAAVAGALLIPPTFLMGGTYPALVRHATLGLGDVGRRASQLYAVNAAGAVVGSLGMAMLLLPLLGVRASLMVLALGNATVGGLALLSARRAKEAAPAPVDSRPANEPPIDEPMLSPARLAISIAFVAGFLSFGLEVAWTRAFAVVMGSSTQSFAVILAAFIAGIAGGSAILSRFEARIRSPLAAFGASQLATALLVLLPLPLLPYLPWVLGRIARGLPATEAGWQAWGGLKLAACLAVMLLPCLGMGVSIPLLVKAVARSSSRIAEQTGRIYAFNTLGNVAGALLVGLVLLPLAGVERLIELSALALSLAGATALVAGAPRAGAVRRGALALGGFGLAGALAVALPPWDPTWMSVASFRRAQIADWDETKEMLARRHVLYMKDDPAANVIVMSSPGKEGDVLSLLVNGKPDASSHGDQPTQLLLAHLPLVLQPDARSVLVIGLATGITSGAVLKHPVQRLDVVDIVRSMPRAAAAFDEWSGRPLEDPRTTFIADDARSWLLSTTETYDVVISEPSNPWTAGTGSLFSTEFYAEAKKHLSPQGIYVQWLQAYELSDENLGAILRSFRSVFPHVTLWETTSLDVLLVGSPSPLDLRADRVAAAMSRPGVAEQLASLGIREPNDVFFLQRFTEPGVEWLASASALQNTDDNLLLEHEAPRDLFLLKTPRLLAASDERASAGPDLAWTAPLREGADPLRLPELMSTRVFGTANLLGSWLAAMQRVNGTPREALPRELLDALPAGVAPPSQETLELELRAAAAEDDLPRLSRLLAGERSAILLASMLSPPSAERWAAELRSDAGLCSGRAATLLRLLRVDVLASSGRVDDARAEIAGATGWDPPPSAEEILLRSCRLDAGASCTETARELLRLTGDPRIERFLELRSVDRRD